MNTGTYTISERRRSARHNIKLEVNLTLEDGTLLPVQSINISNTGMQVLCDSWVVDEIEPRGIQSHSTSHIKLKAIIDLPGENGNKKFYAYCKILSAQRLSQESYSLNLIFTRFEHDSDAAMTNFLNLYQQKKTVVKAIA